MSKLRAEKQKHRVTEFRNWIRKKQLEFMQASGGKRTDREFAEHLGIHERNLNRYLNGKSLPSNELVVILANKLGRELYDLLGWPQPQ